MFYFAISMGVDLVFALFLCPCKTEGGFGASFRLGGYSTTEIHHQPSCFVFNAEDALMFCFVSDKSDI